MLVHADAGGYKPLNWNEQAGRTQGRSSETTLAFAPAKALIAGSVTRSHDLVG